MSSLARTRSLRKPTQGSSTDLPASSAATSSAASATARTAAAAPSSERNFSPSRLPAPRPTAAATAARPTTRTVSSGSLADTAAKKKKPNPISTLLGRSSSTRQAASAAARQRDAGSAPSSASSVGSGPPSAPLTRSSALSASSGLGRTSSTREPGTSRTRYPPNSSSTTTRPTTSGGLPSQKRSTATGETGPVSSHTRARSVATLNGSTVLKPPSQTPSSGATAAPRPRPTSMYGSSSSTAPTKQSGTDRLAMSKPNLSTTSLSSTSTTTTSTTTTTTTATKPTRTARTPPKQQQKQPPQPPRQQPASPTSPRHNKPLLRPAFNTLQQHYSPAKSLAPKPLTATYLAPPSPSKLPTNVALSAETSRLQTELLQLHLLHRDLPSVTSAWHASARSKLATRHASLGKSSKDLAALEADAAERTNVVALHKWASSSSASKGSGGGRGILEDKIQRLDALLTALWSLDAPGGRHNRLVRAFERWASSLAELEAARARADDADPSALLGPDLEVRFGGGLDARWKEECSALVRRLEGWEAHLRELEYSGNDEDGDGAQASSLKRMLDGCGCLVRDMLAELAVMEEIEAAAVERETEWIRRMNREGDDGRRDTPRAGAIWRAV